MGLYAAALRRVVWGAQGRISSLEGAGQVGPPRQPRWPSWVLAGVCGAVAFVFYG